MAVPGPVRPRPIPRGNMVKNRRENRQPRERFARRGSLGGRGGGPGQRHRVGEDEEQERQGQELEAVGPDRVGFEVCQVLVLGVRRGL